MKKKLVMRIASLALCVVFVGMLFGAPKAEAVAAEATAVAIGVAVLASYVAATQLRFTGDVADTISNGISSLVSDWVEASAVAASADDWLANLGNATQMTSPGMLQLQGAFARGCAQFVEWLTETFGLDEDGEEAVAIPGVSGLCSYNGVVFPNIESVWPDMAAYPYGLIFINTSGEYVFMRLEHKVSSGGKGFVYMYRGAGYRYEYKVVDGAWVKSLSGSYSNVQFYCEDIIWTNYDCMKDDGSLLYASSPVPVVSGQLVISLEEGFANPAVDAADDDALTIYTGLLSESLHELAVDVPDAIADGTFAPIPELSEKWEGTDDPAAPDDTTVVPGITPWLRSIFDGIKGIADRIVNGVKGLFVPDQTSVDSFSDVVDAKLPFIGTLQGFGDDLAYKLEHPEECANGLGLTTVVDLGKGRFHYLGSTKHNLLDVSWYLEYKPMVDDIIVGFCWLSFLWNCYGALPRIIHGEGSIAGAISVLREEDGDL